MILVFFDIETEPLYKTTITKFIAEYMYMGTIEDKRFIQQNLSMNRLSVD